MQGQGRRMIYGTPVPGLAAGECRGNGQEACAEKVGAPARRVL